MSGRSPNGPRKALPGPKWIAPLLAAAVLLALQAPWTDTLTYQRSDEGYVGCLVQAYGQGHRLYSELWLDQPPLFFVILHAWFHWFGASLLKGRALIVLGSLLFAVLLHDVIRRRSGPAAAWLALVFLLTNSSYVMMSVTMIQELPAYTFGGLALWLAVRRAEHPRPGLLLALSGAAMACSLMVKLATASIAPVILLDLLLSPSRPTERRADRVRPALAWCAAAGLTLLGLGVLLGVDLAQWVQSHASPLRIPAIEERSGTRMLPIFACANWMPMLMALPAFYYGLRRRERAFAAPLGWLALNVVLLNFYTPVADHYEIHVAVPLAWMAGAAVARVARDLAAAPALSSAMLWPALAAAAALAAIPGNRIRLRAPVWANHPGALEAVRDYAPRTRWMAAIECQIYPFLAGARVIPDLYSTSVKRRLSGGFGPERMLKAMETYRPEQVLLDTLFQYTPGLKAYFSAHYVARFPGAIFVQWVRRDVADPRHDWAADPDGEAALSRNEARIRPWPASLRLLRQGRRHSAKRLLQAAVRLRSPVLAAQQKEAENLLGELLKADRPALGP